MQCKETTDQLTFVRSKHDPIGLLTMPSPLSALAAPYLSDVKPNIDQIGTEERTNTMRTNASCLRQCAVATAC